MNTKVKKESKPKPDEGSVPGQNVNFNFDLWAAQVRQQMIAALNRRGAV
ncbi:hypothetical protein K9N68_00230 [Kovacikia minuta CCNUW1]|nr:hypothetical protein [Kovacikia minuta]UBF26481.1 hypothetical protein K9N68_00230 [Kovacikia minuta CCNUW1]